MSHLIKQDIRPDVLVQQNEYFLLKIPEFNISFLNLQNYLPYEIHDLIKMYKLPVSYPIFPFQTLNEGAFDVTAAPPFEKYTHYTDTEEIRKLKKKAYDELPPVEQGFAALLEPKNFCFCAIHIIFPTLPVFDSRKFNFLL